jgi:undecaprenyl diphosphate synthase
MRVGKRAARATTGEPTANRTTANQTAANRTTANQTAANRTTAVNPAEPSRHPSGARPPEIPPGLVPRHVALVMDGNGRWAKARGLPRTEGHKRGEAALFDVVEGCIELGVRNLSAYAFSTENWKRSPDEVRFLMGFNRDVIRRRRDEMHALGVRVRWAGRRPKLWRSVIRELEEAEELTRGNDVMTLTMCVNYGGRAEIADAAQALARDVAAGRLDPGKVTEAVFARYLDEPDLPEVDLFLRSSGEQRTSNFLLWQSAYAELVFLDTLFPDFDRRHLWQACEIYASRDRRYGGAVPNAVPNVVPDLGAGTNPAPIPGAEVGP